MNDITLRIKELEKEVRNTPYHKATEHHIGKLKARIAKLKEEIIQSRIKKGGGKTRLGGLAIKKTGDATVILVGPPSVGKSSLLNQLTHAQSKVAAYDFTTTSVIPGIMDYKGAQIQILDIPGLISEAAAGKGKGKEIISVIRSTNLVLIIVDIFQTVKIDNIKKDLYLTGFRLDEISPRVSIKKTNSGGLRIISNFNLTKITIETIKSVACEFRIKNGVIILKEDITLERLIDYFIGNRVYLPYLIVINKLDLNPFFYFLKEKSISISAQKGLNIDILKESIWQKLKLIRVYLKEKDKEPDFNQPFILRQGENLRDLLSKISICYKSNFSKAKIFGPGAKFSGQIVNFGFAPLDETIVCFL